MWLEIRRSLPWPQQRREWRMLGQAGLILAVLVLLAFVIFFRPHADRFCDEHQVGCSLMTGFVSTGVVVLVGYLVLFTWTIRRAEGYYKQLARTAPDRVMPTPPRVRASEVVGRDRLMRTVARESAFARKGAPILVIGEAGSGKTTFLLTLTQHLAETGSVPVAVSLRGAPLPLSFRALAQEEFTRRIDPVVRAEGDATRIWRKLAAQGAIVVLADGLDDVGHELPPRQRDHAIRAALVSARNERLAVVATARPETVPFAAPASVFELAPLDQDEALKYVAERVAVEVPPEDEQKLREVVSGGQITHSPLYLNVIAALQRLKTLPQEVSKPKEKLLVELLDSWVDLIEGQKLRPEVELESFTRRRIVEGLAAAAYVMTSASSAETKLSRLSEELASLPRSRSGSDLETGLMIEGASQLDLIEAFVLENDIGVRFNHAITQAYFTSRYLRLEPDARHRLLDDVGTEAVEAVFMWASQSVDDAATTTSELLARADSIDADSALTFCVTAYGLATISRSHDLMEQAAAAIDDRLKRATPRCRLAAIRQLGTRGDERSYQIMYRATRDISYRVRWAAAKAIIDAGSEGYSALEPEFSKALASAEAPCSQWTEEETHDISVLAWMLPGIRGGANGPVVATIESQLERLTRLVPGGMPLGTEASLAQGVKLCALMYPATATSAIAKSLLPECRFWYSRIVLLHAICISGLHNPEERSTAEEQMRKASRNTREHPFVREAARLSAQALKEGNDGDWRRYVWDDDESALISQSASNLSTETAVLIAEVVLLLNLTEQGIDKDEVETRKRETYGRTDLPYCLRASPDMSAQLFQRCDERCPFNLCPYPRSADLVQARGEFSQAFCEHQIELLARRRSLRVPTRGNRAGSWSRTSRAARKRFWEAMQTRAV